MSCLRRVPFPLVEKEPKDAFFTSGLPSVGCRGRGHRSPSRCAAFWFAPNLVHPPAAMTRAHLPAAAPPEGHHPSLRWWSQPLRATARVAPTKYLKRAYFQSSAKRIPSLSIINCQFIDKFQLIARLFGSVFVLGLDISASSVRAGCSRRRDSLRRGGRSALRRFLPGRA